jgi:hypothetical protein
MAEALAEIYSRAHGMSTGPALPDGYWEIRAMASAALAPPAGGGG